MRVHGGGPACVIEPGCWAVSDVCCNFYNIVAKVAWFSHVPTLGCAAASPGRAAGRPRHRAGPEDTPERLRAAEVPGLSASRRFSNGCSMDVKDSFKYIRFGARFGHGSRCHCSPARAPVLPRSCMWPAGCTPLLLPPRDFARETPPLPRNGAHSMHAHGASYTACTAVMSCCIAARCPHTIPCESSAPAPFARRFSMPPALCVVVWPTRCCCSAAICPHMPRSRTRAGRPMWSLRMRPAAGGGCAPMGRSEGGWGGQHERALGAIGARSARHAARRELTTMSSARAPCAPSVAPIGAIEGVYLRWGGAAHPSGSR